MTISEDMLLDVKSWASANEVTCLQSLYKADAGLQHLGDVGLTDGTFSKDADFFPLNSKRWATKVNFSKGTLMILDSRRIREALSKQFFPAGDVHMTADHGRVLSVILRCDFLPRPSGYGPEAAEKFVAQWMISTKKENDRSLIGIEVGKKKRKNGDREMLCSDAISDYSRKFWDAFNMLKHPPIFKFTTFSDDTSVHVGLLGLDDRTLSREFVTTKLGFDAFENITSLGDFRGLLFMRNNNFVRTGMPLLPILQPRNSEGLLLPWGSTNYFIIWPPVMCTYDMLNRWLRSRSLRLNTRCHLLAFAAKVEKQLQATVSIQ